MGLKTLVRILIFLTLSTSISSNPKVNSKQEQESHCPKSIKSTSTRGKVKRDACSAKGQSVHAVEVRILNEYGNRVLPFYSKKELGMKEEGRINLAGRRTPVSSKKNRASTLHRPCSFVVCVFPCIVAFAFLLLLPL